MPMPLSPAGRVQTTHNSYRICGTMHRFPSDAEPATIPLPLRIGCYQVGWIAEEDWCRRGCSFPAARVDALATIIDEVSYRLVAGDPCVELGQPFLVGHFVPDFSPFAFDADLFFDGFPHQAGHVLPVGGCLASKAGLDLRTDG